MHLRCVDVLEAQREQIYNAIGRVRLLLAHLDIAAMHISEIAPVESPHGDVYEELRVYYLNKAIEQLRDVAEKLKHKIVEINNYVCIADSVAELRNLHDALRECKSL